MTFSGTTAIFPFILPDALEADDYPTAEQRHTPIDVSNAACGINQQKTRIELSCPAGWKLLSLPEKVSLSSRYGMYEITFSRKGNAIICERTARFSSYGLITMEEYEPFKEFCNKIAKADAVQLVFTTK